MKKQIGIIEICMRHSRIMLFIIALLVFLGVYAVKVMPKQEFPVFTIRQGIVVAVYPGATTEEVEEQVAKPLEQFLFTYKEINRDKTYSMSRDGILYVMVDLSDDVNNKDEVWSKIKLGLQSFKMQLPSGVLALIAKDDFGDTSALLISLESKDKTYRELEDYLTILEEKLRRIESVSNLRRYGTQNEQISVYLEKEKLVNYGINNKLIYANLFTQGFTTTGGRLENRTSEIPIYVKKTYESEREIAEQIIYSSPNGDVIRLKDVAKIVREYDRPNSYIVNNGTKAILLSMEMREGNNIVEYGQEVDNVLSEFQQVLPASVSVKRIADQPKVVDDSVSSFLRDLVISILVVIAVMMFLFPFRSAVVAATSIPISVFISIGVMYICGIELNTVTLAALIVVLGMIVDNSIIVVDAYLENIDHGMSRWDAAVHSAQDYFGSILLATFCICIIFFPLLVTTTGEIRDFLTYFPWTLSISLMVSLIIAMVFIPYMEHQLIKTGLATKVEKKKAKSHFDMLEAVQKGYEKVLDFTFRNSHMTILAGIGSIVAALFIFMGIDQRLLPKVDRNQFAIEITLPQGASLSETETVCDSVYQVLAADNRVESVTEFIGMASPRFQATYAPNIGSKHYAQFIVNTKSVEATRTLLDDYTNEYADKYPNAYVKFKQLDYNEVTSIIEIRLRGDDIMQLRQYADTMIRQFQQMEGLVYVHHNYEQMLPSVDVKLDPIKSAQLGVTKAMVSNDLALKYGGIQTGTLWEDDYGLPIVLQTNEKNAIDELNGVGDEYVSTLTGSQVPLRQIAEVSPEWHSGQIVRRNGVRTISIMADVKRGYSEYQTFKSIDTYLKNTFVQKLPDTIEMEYGGSYEHDNETIIPILAGLGVAIVIIFFFLLFNFKKMSIASTALGSVMLCLLGAAFGLWVSGYDVSITCILGIVSLLGIIVRNAIIMFDHAENLHHNEGYTARDAAYDAGKRRMLPIFLTSATTAVGVIPMIVSRSSLWAPMGVIICLGTVVSLILVVTVLPVLYWKIYRKDQ